MTDRVAMSWSDSQGRHELDVQALVARLTGTEPDGWTLTGEEEGDVKVLALDEPSRPTMWWVAGHIEQGADSMNGWSLHADGDLGQADRERVAGLVEQGHTGGENPNWSLELGEARRVARVWPMYEEGLYVAVDWGDHEEFEVQYGTEEIVGPDSGLSDLLTTESTPAP